MLMRYSNHYLCMQSSRPGCTPRGGGGGWRGVPGGFLGGRVVSEIGFIKLEVNSCTSLQIKVVFFRQ